MIQVKLCGMTRATDAAAAAELGADYVGVVFAGGPRTLTTARALEVLAPVRGRALAIGVFGSGEPGAIVNMAREAHLDGIQLHGDPTPQDVAAVRARFEGIVWAAYRVRAGVVGDEAAPLFAAADGIVLDAHSDDLLGGTGRTLPWSALAVELEALRPGRAALVLAGGLRATNVGAAIAALRPDVVDVSSGIESTPGLKDHTQMRAFMDAARMKAAMPRSETE